MPWSRRSGRSAPLPKNWWKIRTQVLKRDGYRCTHVREDTGAACGLKATDVHHLGDPNDYRLHTLTSLCSYHHRVETSRQGGSRARSKSSRPVHPGLVG